MKSLLLSLVFVLSACLPSQAAWARHTSATLTGTSNTGSTFNAGAIGVTPTANDRIICVVAISALIAAGQPTVNGVVDDAGDVYNRDFLLQHQYIGTEYAGIEFWSAVANGGAASNLTFTWNYSLTAVAGAAIACGAYSGVDTSVGAAAAVDISVGSFGSATSPADSGTTGGTTGAASELKLGGYADDGTNQAIGAGTLDTNYSKWVQAQSTTAQAMLEDADSGSSGSTARATATYSGSVNWQMAVVVYKISGGVAAAPCNLRLLGVGCH